MTNLSNVYKILSECLQLPILFRHSDEKSRQPLNLSASLLEKSDDLNLRLIPGPPPVVQYLTTTFNEHFVYLPVSRELEVFVGPFLNQPLSETQISEMFRSSQLPLNKKAEITEYFHHLPVVNEERFFYIGKLLELLFLDQKSLNEKTSNQALETSSLSTQLSETEHHKGMFRHAPYFLELEMTKLVTTGDLESALNTMNSINTFNRAVLSRDPIRSLKNSLICNCTFLARAAIAGGVSPEDAFALSDRLINNTEDTNTIAELQQQERKNLIEFVMLVHTYNSSHYTKPIRDAIGYINNHLCEDLSLNQLASITYMHPNYFSALFKKETGSSLSQYILKRRIEEAKFLLRYSSDSISTIAYFYQFSSQSHFTKWFSKFVGMSPLKFRKSLEGQTLPS